MSTTSDATSQACSYVRPLDENYGRAWFEVHKQTLEAERLLKSNTKMNEDIENTVRVVFRKTAGVAPERLRLVNLMPGKFLPADHKSLMDLISHDMISVHCTIPIREWVKQDVTMLFLVSLDNILLCDVMLTESDLVDFQKELQLLMVAPARKRVLDVPTHNASSPLKRRRVTVAGAILSSQYPIPPSPSPGPSPLLPSLTPDLSSSISHPTLITQSLPASLNSSDRMLSSPPARKSNGGTKTFPWKYVCDMHLPMASLSKLKSAADIEAQFPHHFPNMDFVLKTFWKHRKPFLQAVSLGMVQPMADMGRTDGAEWSWLKANVERRLNGGMLFTIYFNRSLHLILL
ncbi:hypothetical protein PAXRUDRAFT_164233 [Paxillus rubicundulus Ve08.2h10]|uniref:Uncharacterized protein n=1 Tax=Paxillus rubicundulus Ve08.2h10 TaxID=930991 RepID=A0A0D0C5C5_9AGAM|nr:hypothetical protein PAXRUDRAFT_164233 [Paxillus rubicundulus Ve08.2h10]